MQITPILILEHLYNLLVCVVVAVTVTLATNKQNQIVKSLKSNSNGKASVYSLLAASVINIFNRTF